MCGGKGGGGGCVPLSQQFGFYLPITDLLVSDMICHNITIVNCMYSLLANVQNSQWFVTMVTIVL